MKTYDVREAAGYCKCHPETIKEKINDGSLFAIKVGRKWVMTQKDLDLYFENLKNKRLQEMQAERSKLCQSDCVVKYGKSMLSRPAVKELDSLLAQATKSKLRNCMTN